MGLALCTRIILILSVLIGTIHSTVVLDGNGYTGLLLAISEDVEQPSDGGLQFINNLEVSFHLYFINLQVL